MRIPEQACNSFSPLSSPNEPIGEATNTDIQGIRHISFNEFMASLSDKSKSAQPISTSITTALRDKQQLVPCNKKVLRNKDGHNTVKKHAMRKEDHFLEKSQQSNILTFVSPPKISTVSVNAEGATELAVNHKETTESPPVCQSFSLRRMSDTTTSKLSSCGKPQMLVNDCCSFLPVQDVDEYIEQLITEHPDFPVRKYLNTMKKHFSESFDTVDTRSLLWTDKYTPYGCSTLLYNGSSFDELRCWLERWRNLTTSSDKPKESRRMNRNRIAKVTSGCKPIQIDSFDSGDDDFILTTPAAKRRRTSRKPKSPHDRPLSHQTPHPINEIGRPIGWKPSRANDSSRCSEIDGYQSDSTSDDLMDRDFVAFGSEEGEEDEDSRSGTRRRIVPEWRSKAYLLLGPTGVGKTSMVYALANDMGFKVFELNPATRRSGKDLSDQFQVALESHHVSKEHLVQSFSTFHMTNLVKSSFDRTSLKKKRQSRNASNFFQPRTESNGSVKKKIPNKKVSGGQALKGLNLSCNSLVLLDEVDVLFDSDRGFWSGLDNLLQLGRRPIILTASNPCVVNELPIAAHVCRIKPPDLNLVIPFLRVVCLAEGHMLNATEAKFVCQMVRSEQHTFEICSSHAPSSHLDLRRVLTALQWYATSSVLRCTNSNTGAVTPCLSLHNGFSCLDRVHELCPQLCSLSIQSPAPENAVISGKSVTELNLADESSLDAVFDEESNKLIKPASSNAISPTVPSIPTDRSDPIQRRNMARFISRALRDLETICTRWSNLELYQACFARSHQLHLLDAPEESVHFFPQEMTPGVSNHSVSTPHSRSSTCTVKVNPLMTQLTPSLGPFEFTQDTLFEQFWPSILSHWSTCRLLECEQSIQKALIPISPQPVTHTKCRDSFQSSHTTRQVISELTEHNAGGSSFKPAFSRCGRKAMALDYLPCLRIFASGEATKQAIANRRRFFHYFDRISLHFNPWIRLTLTKPVFRPHT
ncbi:hypothetical protein D915_008867 [Fasciola hepatica]|uniref:AAA+ ATPase domain-containing protein n=1 Tax=Fasciola hepatica TaxID=6192 RepID=A0A4E0RF09_FASHE|nr:hypothetical protein D915_008867 [Fasciola hepatica]